MIKLNRNNKAAALVEYAILTALVGGVSLGVTLGFGAEVNTAFGDISESVSVAAMTPTTGDAASQAAPVAAASWTGGPVCLYQSPWQYFGSSFTGQSTSPTGSQIQISVAFWFGDNAETGQTPNGSPILFSVPDTNGDGIIQASELNEVSGYDFVSSGNRIAYATSGQLAASMGNSVVLMSEVVHPDANGDFMIDGGDFITPMLGQTDDLNPATITIGCG